MRECVNRDQDYLFRTSLFGEVGLCTEAKEESGEAVFPHHHRITEW